MTRVKAQKHLRYATESLEFWREKYVEACREKSSVMDVKYSIYDGRTLREVKKAEAIAEINDAKRRIANAQRIAL